MSEENVELVKSANEAFIAGERNAFVDDFFAADVEVFPDASFPEANPLRGREAFKRWLAETDRGWENSATLEVREVFSVGDRVVSRNDWVGRGQVSGIDLHTNLSIVCTVRDGSIVKAQYFFDHGQALKAAGLSE